MGLGKTLSNEAVQYGVLAISLVIMIVLLSKIKGTSSASAVVCPSGYNWNGSRNLCCLEGFSGPDVCSGTNTTSQATAGTFIDDFSTGLAEPKNWISIIVIAVIGFGIIKFMQHKGKGDSTY